MTKKEIKEELKNHFKNTEENQMDLKTLDILKSSSPYLSNNLLTQDQIRKNVNLYTNEKSFNLILENGPYRASYTQNGSNLLINNNSGYIATYNTQNLNIGFEIDIHDKIYDAKWLHNEMYLATAQKDCVFIYNNVGVELHAVRDINSPKMLEFLPYHFLLACNSATGMLKYLDTSIGSVVAEIDIKEEYSTKMKSNPSNGVIHIGSKNGNVALWAPSQQSYLMKVQCHNSAITNIEIDRSGNRMITTGLDGKLKIFDIRQTFTPIKAVNTKNNVQYTAISQKNLLALGFSNKLAILKDCEEIYMKHNVGHSISSLEFCNYEDILTVGHFNGISNVIVPGSGDPTYDSLECTPFMTKNQRKEMEVKRLLEKIPFDMISQEGLLGNVNTLTKKKKPQVSERYYENVEAPRTALSRFQKKD